MAVLRRRLRGDRPRQRLLQRGLGGEHPELRPPRCVGAPTERVPCRGDKHLEDRLPTQKAGQKGGERESKGITELSMTRQLLLRRLPCTATFASGHTWELAAAMPEVA